MKYILFALILFACHNPHQKASRQISTEVLDTIKSTPAKLTATPVLFETAFVNGTKEDLNGATLSLYGVTIGKIKVVSGHLIACDPLHIDEYGIPFTQVFPTGEFPVQLSIGKLKGEETVAFARINFSDAPVEKWEFALQKGQQPHPVGGKEMHGYSVDGGVGIYMDEAAIKALDNSTVANFEGKVFKDMNKHYHNDWRYTMYDFGTHNLAAFTTGVGDGYYGTYIGFDAAGNPCRLLTDFGIFNWRKK